MSDDEARRCADLEAKLAGMYGPHCSNCFGSFRVYGSPRCKHCMDLAPGERRKYPDHRNPQSGL